MSLTIPILSALLLSLISGSTEGGQRMDSVALLRQTLRYWRKIYKTYHEEVALGYCWADYLLEISDELSTNLSAPTLVATGDRNTTVGATKSQQNPFPQNAMVDTMMPFRETWKGKHLREKRSRDTSTRFAISRFTNYSDERRVTSKVKMIQEKWIMMNKTLPIIPNNKKTSKIDGNKRTMINLYIRKKRQPFSIVSEFFHDQREILRGQEFSSRKMYSGTVNSTPNPKDDDKAGFESMDLEKNREVLFSREKSLGNRFLFRQYPQSRERNSRVDELLSDPWTPEDRGMKRDPEGDRIPLNNCGSSLSFCLQFQRINAATVRCTGIVKLTNFVANSSCNPARVINLEMSRRKPKVLSRDSLLLPRGERIAERSPLESRGSGRETVKKNAFSRFGEIAGGNYTKQPRYQQPRVEKRSRVERDVSPGMIHPFFLLRLERSHQQMLYENRILFPILTIPEGSKQDDDHIRAVKDAPSLSRVGRFIENYENSTSGSVEDSRLTALQARQLSVRSVIITVFRTLGIFVQVGRQIMDVVESNAILTCTKDYLWTKIIRWIDS